MTNLKEKYKKEFVDWHIQNEHNEIYKKYEFIDWLIKIKGEKLGYIKKYNFIKRWLEAEEYIKTNPEYAYWYARDIIEGKWPEAEEYIKKDPYWWCMYKK